MKVNNTVSTASAKTAVKASNTKASNASKSSTKASNTKASNASKSSTKASGTKASSTSKGSTKATSNKTTGTAKSSKMESTNKNSSKAQSSKTASTVKSSTQVRSSKVASTAKSSTQAGNGKIASATKTGVQSTSNKSLGDSKSNMKSSIGSAIANNLTSAVKSIMSSPSKENTNLVSSNSSSVTSSVTKYIVDAPALYTSQALKIVTGKVTSSLDVQLHKGYVPGMPSETYQKVKQNNQSSKDYLPGMPSDIFKKVKTTQKSKFNGKTPTINKMLSNLDKDKTLGMNSDQKKVMLYAGEKMLNAGYDAKFVAGVLANICYEGEPGQFEKSNYSDLENKPEYLKHIDKDFNYREKYSGKNIGEVGIKETVKLQEEASKKKFTYPDEVGKEIEDNEKFGLGMFQFTGTRTSGVLEEYQAFYKRTGENYPNKEQCMKIEIDYALKELKSRPYNDIYSSWEDGDKTAYSAGKLFCKKYEIPEFKEQLNIRGKEAEEIYTVMKKK